MSRKPFPDALSCRSICLNPFKRSFPSISGSIPRSLNIRLGVRPFCILSQNISLNSAEKYTLYSSAANTKGLLRSSAISPSFSFFLAMILVFVLWCENGVNLKKQPFLITFYRKNRPLIETCFSIFTYYNVFGRKSWPPVKKSSISLLKLLEWGCNRSGLNLQGLSSVK